MTSTDERIGRTVEQLRGSMSQRELASRMRDRGWKWSHLTVASVERGERPLRLSEAIDLEELLGGSIDPRKSSEDLRALAAQDHLWATVHELQNATSAYLDAQNKLRHFASLATPELGARLVQGMDGITPEMLVAEWTQHQERDRG